jgi:malectin (di-glucose binding ER protein)/thrombospondin type 3 repeat protein
MIRNMFSGTLPTFYRSAAYSRFGIGLWAFVLLLLVLSTNAFAAPITFTWDVVSDADLAGYKLYYGYASGQYSVNVNVGKYTTATLSGLDEAQVYYIAAVAYDTAGNESAFSNEVKYDLAAHDTDKDGLNDWDEISFYKTDPSRADTDGDGLSDGAEVNVHHTDPTRVDTDDDGVWDGAEVSKGSNPLDGDSLPGQEQVVFAVNAGGTQYTGTDGTVYQADIRFSGGKTDTKTPAIAGTTDDPLYQSWRYGNFSYAVPVVNGNYLVTLKFADNLWSQAGQRVFNVSIEGKVVLSKLDVAAKVGINAAYEVTLPVTVTDGVLTISFQSVVGNAMVSAIAVLAK